MELMHYLHEVMRDPRLTEESRKILSDWIVSESVYLPVAAVLDGWRIGAFKRLLSSQKINESPKASDTKVNSEEIRQFAAAIADHISHMEPGESFKMLSGHFSHETRFVVARNEDGAFTTYHYDTGGSFGYTKTAVKISEVDGKRLQELDFWQKFISLKVTEDGMRMMNGLIRGLGKMETLSEELCKPVQRSNSCPFHAVEAEFKHTFVSHHRDLQVGLEQYKICTALMAEHAKNFESKTTDPALKDVFLAKEKIRHRYLNWVEIAQNQEQYERVKNQYIDAIKKMAEDGQFESNIDEILRIEENSFVNTLEALNKKFEKCLKKRTKNKFGRSEVELLERLNISQELWMQCSGRIKSKTLLEFTLPHLRKNLKANSGIIGKCLEALRNFLLHILPRHLSYFVESHLYIGEIASNWFLDNLEKLVDSGNEKEVQPIIRQYLRSPLYDHRTMGYVFRDLCNKGYFETATEVAKKLLKKNDLGRINKMRCLALVDPDQLLTYISSEDHHNYTSSTLYMFEGKIMRPTELVMELLTQKKSPLFLAILKKLLSIHLDDKTDIFHLSVLNVVKDFVNAFPDEAFEFFKENPSPRAISKLLTVSSKLSAEQKEELYRSVVNRMRNFF